MQKLNVFFPALLLYLLLSLPSFCQVYTSDNLTNLLEMKTITIRLSESLTLRETLLSQREQDWTVRERTLTDLESDLMQKEKDLKVREEYTKRSEKIYSDLNISLTKTLKENKVVKKFLWVSLAVIIGQGIVIYLK
jgi:hypothetical protein